MKGKKMSTSEEKWADFGRGIFLMATSYVIFLGIAFPLKWAWNYVMPHLFELSSLTWGQSFCLLFVCSMLIKSYSYLPRD